MTFKISGRVFFHLPVGDTTGPANSRKPFISKPARRPAVSGVSDHKRFIAMGCDARLISHSVNRLNSMQQPFARRPELYFFNESKKLNPFTIVSLGGLFIWFLFCHSVRSPGYGLEAGSPEI